MKASDFELPKGEILIVEDNPSSLQMLSELLQEVGYTIRQAADGEMGLCTAMVRPPDLILLDILMPGMSGFEVCTQLKTSPQTRHVPVIFLSALNDTPDKVNCFRVGAVDYVTKPFQVEEVLARVSTHVALKQATDLLRSHNERLEEKVAQRTLEIRAIQDVTIMALASLAETRDNETGNHIRRTQYYVRALAEHLRWHPRFCHYLNDQNIETLFKSAPLHDIGKVGIPDHILLKPQRLTAEEFEVMKSHTLIGTHAIASAEERLGLKVDFLPCAKEIAYSHHERWDGSGYPQGLKGDDIPISARLMSLADVYDAMISQRIYKEALPPQEAIEAIREERGRMFDPDIVDAFLEICDQFDGIAKSYADR